MSIIDQKLRIFQNYRTEESHTILNLFIRYESIFYIFANNLVGSCLYLKRINQDLANLSFHFFFFFQ